MSLRSYQDELIKVEIKLIKDPNNQDLVDLKNDLKELIQLEGGHIDIEEEETLYEVGCFVGAKFTDDKYYKANITNINDNIYTIQFVGFPELHNLKISDICVWTNDIKERGIKNNEYLKRKKEKKKARMNEKIKEQSKTFEKSQQKWQKFKKPAGNGKLEKLDDVIGNGTLSRLHK